MAKTVFTAQQIADHLTRDGGYWYGDNGDAVIKYSFSSSLGSWWSNDSEYAMGATQKAWVRLALSHLESVFNLEFQEVSQPSNSGANPPYDIIQFVNDINTGTYSSSYSYTGGAALGGIAFNAVVLDMSWNSNQPGNLAYGSYGYMTILHEILHSLGLEHPGDYDAGNGGPITYANDAEFAQDTHRYTVMSYFSAEQDGSGAVYYDTVANAWVYPRTLMVYDILAMTSGSFNGNFGGYGVNAAHHAADTTYGYNVTAGTDSAFDFASHGAPVATIHDTGGIDTLDLSGDTDAKQAVVTYKADGTPVLSIITRTETLIDLREGQYSSTHGMTYNLGIAYGTVIENAIGTRFRDTIHGNGADNRLEGGLGNDILYGYEGSDTLIGGAGSDKLYGGGGNDFIYYDPMDDWNFVFGGDGIDTLIFVDMTFPAGLSYAANGFEYLEVQEIDTLDQYSWESRSTVYSIGLEVLSTGISHDDGTSEETLYDINDAYGWAEYSSLYTASGQLAQETYVYDDGSVQVITHLTTPEYNDITGSNGKNRINGTAAADRIDALGGADTVRGNDGDDLIDGGSGKDKLYGDIGNDIIYGGLSNDLLNSGEGDDTLYGGLGNDRLFGGLGADTFMLEAFSGRDVIYDFQDGIDQFSLEGTGYVFEDLTITKVKAGYLIRTADNGIYVTVKGAGHIIDATDFSDDTASAQQNSLSQWLTNDYIFT